MVFNVCPPLHVLAVRLQAAIPEFNGLCIDLGWSQLGWGDWADGHQPHATQPPGKFASVRPILKLILLKVSMGLRSAHVVAFCCCYLFF